MDLDPLPTIKCNACWACIAANSKCIITACVHVYCEPCARNIVVSGAGCRVCGHRVTREGVKVLEVLPCNAKRAQHSLLGQTPEVALQAAAASVRFFRQQQVLAERAREEEMQAMAGNIKAKYDQKMGKLRQNCEMQLSKIHTAYKTAKRKAMELEQHNGQLNQELQEVVAKYEQKSKQARNLNQQVQQLQQHLQLTGPQQGRQPQLVHHSSGRGGGGGGGGGSALLGAFVTSPMLGGGPGGRSVGGHAPHHHQTVTTVRQMQATIDIMSPGMPALGGNGFLPGSAGRHPSSAGGGSRQRAMLGVGYHAGSGAAGHLGNGGGGGGGSLLRGGSPGLGPAADSPGLMHAGGAVRGGGGGGSLDGHHHGSAGALDLGGRNAAGRMQRSSGAGAALNTLLGGPPGLGAGGGRPAVHGGGGLLGGGIAPLSRGLMMSPSMMHTA